MSAWVIRGLGMAVLHGAAITLLAKYAVYHPTDQTLVISIALAVLVGAAALWSALDAWRGLPDRGKVWFISALVAGPVAGILYVIGRAVFVDQTGVSELGGALTGGAAFSALLVLIPAGLGLFVGGRIGRSEPVSADDDPDDALPSPTRRRPAVSEEPAAAEDGSPSPRALRRRPVREEPVAAEDGSTPPRATRRRPVSGEPASRAAGASRIPPRPPRRRQPPSEAPRG
jgi:phosphate/sulfate permease